MTAQLSAAAPPTEAVDVEVDGATVPGARGEPLVAALRRAGAIILGKTTTSEFGWKGVSHSPLTGITHNPWKEVYNARASSAGPRRTPRPDRAQSTDLTPAHS